MNEPKSVLTIDGTRLFHYETNAKSTSGSPEGRKGRLTSLRRTKLTMNGQLTWRLCQLTTMVAFGLRPKLIVDVPGWLIVTGYIRNSNRVRVSKNMFIYGWKSLLDSWRAHYSPKFGISLQTAIIRQSSNFIKRSSNQTVCDKSKLNLSCIYIIVFYCYSFRQLWEIVLALIIVMFIRIVIHYINRIEKATTFKCVCVAHACIVSRLLSALIQMRIFSRLFSYVARDDTHAGFEKSSNPWYLIPSGSRSETSSWEVGEGAVPRDGTFLITYTHAAASRDDYKSSGAPPSKVITAWILDNVAASTAHSPAQLTEPPAFRSTNPRSTVNRSSLHRIFVNPQFSIANGKPVKRYTCNPYTWLWPNK